MNGGGGFLYFLTSAPVQYIKFKYWYWTIIFDVVFHCSQRINDTCITRVKNFFQWIVRFPSLVCLLAWQPSFVKINFLAGCLFFALNKGSYTTGICVRESTIFKIKRIAPKGLMVYLGLVLFTQHKLHHLPYGSLTGYLLRCTERQSHWWCFCKQVHLGLIPKVDWSATLSCSRCWLGTPLLASHAVRLGWLGLAGLDLSIDSRSQILSTRRYTLQE